MTENHYWKHTDGMCALTTQENNDMGENWTEITYEQYVEFLRKPKLIEKENDEQS
jgi:hypothetical protein